MTLYLSLLALALSGFAALMFLGNLSLFRQVDAPPAADGTGGPDRLPTDGRPGVSILIPARDEEQSIGGCVRSCLALEGVQLEVLVMDDGSTDATAEVVAGLAAGDPRVRLLQGSGLPPGWNGKQHACTRLAETATLDRLLFLDADVRLKPDAVARLVQRQSLSVGESPIDLLSAFPHQITGTWAEKLLIPMMHQILLCYLPLKRMRHSSHPAYSAGCGQLFLADADAYRGSGTHAAIAMSRHDGLKLPQAFRKAGRLTDCIDGSDLAECRMYRSAGEVLRGLLKNADEGIANVRLLLPFTFLLGGGFVLPWVTLAYSLIELFGTDVNDGKAATTDWNAIGALVFSLLAIGLGYLPRVVAAKVFRQSWIGAAFHPVAVAVFLMLQWWAFANGLFGRRVAWRGRVES